MTASPRSGPALLIAACILTVTGTVFAGNSEVNSQPAERRGQLMPQDKSRPTGSTTPRPVQADPSTNTRATPVSTPSRTTSPHPRPRPRELRQNRQWLLRLVAPLRRPGPRPALRLAITD